MNGTSRYGYGLCLALALLAAADTASARAPEHKKFQPFLTRGETTWSISAGVRQNDFDWNIASDLSGNATPNILSKLTWESVTVFEIKGDVTHERPLDIGPIDGSIHLEAGLGGGFTFSGDNQDSDYDGDNRTLEFSRSNNDASGGGTIGASAALGYKFHLTGGDPTNRTRALTAGPAPRTAAGRARQQRALKKAMSRATPAISLMPLAGYGWDQQNFVVTDGVQTIPPTGPFDGLDTEYLAEWYGPFAGLEAEIAGRKNMFRLRGEYHDLSYYAEAQWNLRAGFRQDPSFIHEAEGDGLRLNAEYAYAFGNDYALTVDATWQQRNAEDGIDQVFLVNGTNPRLRLNEVNDEMRALHIGLRYIW